MPAIKSAISVGLLYVPVSLQKTTRDTSIHFNQLCKDTHQRIKYQKYCPSCNKEIKNEDIVKGYEFEKGQYVTITEDELEKIKTKADKTIHIIHFAKMSEIDPILFEKNYYVVPEPGGERAFELLRQALLTKKSVAIAKTVLGTKEELLCLYPEKDGILARILFYQEEIQAMPKTITNIKVEKSELDIAKTLIDSMSQKFDIAAYYDEYQKRLREAIESKIQGKEIVMADASQPGNIIDLMEALKKTVEMRKGHKGTA